MTTVTIGVVATMVTSNKNIGLMQDMTRTKLVSIIQTINLASSVAQMMVLRGKISSDHGNAMMDTEKIRCQSAVQTLALGHQNIYATVTAALAIIIIANAMIINNLMKHVNLADLVKFDRLLGIDQDRGQFRPLVRKHLMSSNMVTIRQSGERDKQSEERAKNSEERANQSEERAKQSEERDKQSEEREQQSEERDKQSEERTRQSGERASQSGEKAIALRVTKIKVATVNLATAGSQKQCRA